MDFAAFSVGITLDLSLVGAAQVVAAGEQGVALTAIDVESVVGGTGNDVLIGNASDNGFTGGLGSDTIIGSGGTDVLVETGDANFTLTDIQLVRSGGGSDILSSIERVMLTGGAGANVLDATAYTGVAVLSGEGGNDTLLGGTGNDMLTGGAGDDVLRGGNGGDTYVYDLDNIAGSDVIDEVGGTGGGIDAISFAETSGVGVRLDLALTAIQVVSTGRLTLRLTDGLSVECAAGGAGDDILLGNAAANLLSGGLGMDQIDGRGGPNDFVREDRDADMTVVGTTASATLQIGAETDQLVGIEHVMLVGGNSGNVLDATAFAGSAWLEGRGGDDELYGGSAADSLLGGDGDDLLRGNGGDDALMGGKGQDVYFFDQSSPQGLDWVVELAAEGFADRLVGAGMSGIDVDLFTNAIQVIGPNLSLQLWLAGTVEFSP